MEIKRPQVFSIEEIQAVLDRAWSDPLHYALIATFFYTALRRDSVRRLNLIDLDFTRERIYINQAKGGVNTYIEMSPHLKVILREYIDRYRVEPDVPRDREALFISPEHGGKSARRVSYASIGRIVKRNACKARLSGMTPHSIRRSVITYMAEQGKTALEISTLSLHKDLNTLKLHYLNFADPKRKEIVAVLPAFSDHRGIVI